MGKMFIKKSVTPLFPSPMHLPTFMAYKVNLSVMEGGGSGSTNLICTLLAGYIQISAHQI